MTLALFINVLIIIIIIINMKFITCHRDLRLAVSVKYRDILQRLLRNRNIEEQTTNSRLGMGRRIKVGSGFRYRLLTISRYRFVFLYFFHFALLVVLLP